MSRHDPGEEIVSPLNGVAVGLWLLTIPAVGIIIRYVDLLDGRASIPLLFYGIFVLALLVDGLEFLWPGPYLRTWKDELRIGPRVRIARDEITHIGVERIGWAFAAFASCASTGVDGVKRLSCLPDCRMRW